MSKPLDTATITAALQELTGWQFKDDRLVKSFKFEHFREAFSFLTRVAFEAETHQHHPEIHNIYNQVTLSL
ncbi:MAG: 4a-hydroxytetrahydrobiopterin dehydratase, partial [Phycisphaeraceae bacterium]|nr:4a-hydroxytetrahydrobiopterin dehydratase [Phycisphaeraceae bacterium]